MDKVPKSQRGDGLRRMYFKAGAFSVAACLIALCTWRLSEAQIGAETAHDELSRSYVNTLLAEASKVPVDAKVKLLTTAGEYLNHEEDAHHGREHIHQPHGPEEDEVVALSKRLSHEIADTSRVLLKLSLFKKGLKDAQEQKVVDSLTYYFRRSNRDKIVLLEAISKH